MILQQPLYKVYSNTTAEVYLSLQEPERNCPLGAAPDPCLCCPLGVCGLEEDQLCYNASIFKDSPDRRRLGVCATNMICDLRKDLRPSVS